VNGVWHGNKLDSLLISIADASRRRSYTSYKTLFVIIGEVTDGDRNDFRGELKSQIYISGCGGKQTLIVLRTASGGWV